MLLLELGVSEDILKERVALWLLRANSYTKRPQGKTERGTMQVVGKGKATTKLELRRWDDCLI